MKNFGVAGSGRWAREIIKILNRILDKETLITIYSGRGINGIKKWLDKNPFDGRTFKLRSYESIDKDIQDAFIVANAAKDHFKITKKIINKNVPVLVEKPICLSYEDTDDLIKLSSKKDVLLGTSQIFLFTDYLANFRKIIKLNKKISSINFNWCDAKKEKRYGQEKRFDEGVPIFKDVLPHILSILIFVLEAKKLSFENLIYEGGGAYLTINIKIEDIPCKINIKRNSDSRKRIVKIIGDKRVELNFSTEPGFIKQNKTKTSSDKNWAKSESPATKMIRSYLDTITKNKNLDPRIDPNVDIYYLIEVIDKEYKRKQKKFFKKILNNEDYSMKDLDYLIKEYILEKSLASYESIDNILKKIKVTLTANKKNFNKLLNKDLSAFVRMHL
tara:strand:+ start:1478 stop:2641 length:1164 start_codon:yes stop_codon:yes gene_type:complete